MRSDCSRVGLYSYVFTTECQLIEASNSEGMAEGKGNKSYRTLPPAMDDVEPVLSFDFVNCPLQIFRMEFDGPEKKLMAF